MSVTESELIREIRLLRHEVAVLRRQRMPHIRHAWLGVLLRDLEYNPHTQYTVHLYGVVYWLFNFPVILFLYVFFPDTWVSIGLLITLMYSIYANLATDYSGMSASMAAMHDPPLPEIPLETSRTSDADE